MIRQKLTHLLFLSLLLGALPCQAAINDAEAVNRAGQQRMLSQRVAKSYLMIGTDTRTEQALTQLDQSVASAEENSLLLADYAPNASIRAAVDEAFATWQQFRELALGKPDKANSLDVLRLAERFLSQSEGW